MKKDYTGLRMDDEVKKELEAIEGRLSLSVKELIHDAITEGFKGVEGILTKLFDKDIGHIQEWINTLKKYHMDHYKAAENIRNEMSEMRNAVTIEIDKKTDPLAKRLDNLEGRQLADEVTVKVTDKIEDKKIKKSELNIGFISLIIAIAVGIGTFIGYLI